MSQSNFRNRHWWPAIGAFAVKRLRPAKLKRLQLAIPVEFRLPVRLLAALPLSSLNEIRRLHRDCFDADASSISYTDSQGVARVETLPPDLAVEVVEHLARTADQASVRGWMFCGRKGQPLGREHFVKHVFREGFKAAGIDPMTRVHNLRHTWITTQIEFGSDDLALAYRAGHHDASFTRAQYGHIRERIRRQVADTYPTAAQPGVNSARTGVG